MACDWEPIGAFESMMQYNDFRKRLEEQVNNGQAAQIQVASPYSGSTLWDEHWYKCQEDGTVWRLVRPDPPFRGIFKPVI